MAKTCNGCGTNNTENIVMPFAAHESDMARSERTFKKMWIIILVLIGALIGSNLAWIIYESQYNTVKSTFKNYEIEQETGDGGNNGTIINGGDIING